MINHVRTLLINNKGASWLSIPGAEYQDPRYLEVTLPEAVQRVRDIVFGPTPDRIMLNYRVQQLLRIIESSRFYDHLTYWDVRRTDNTSTRWEPAVFTPKIKTILGSRDPILVGELEAPDRVGICRTDFDVRFSGSTVRVIRTTEPMSDISHTIVDSGNMTNPVPLTGTSMMIQCPTNENGQWAVQLTGRPVAAIDRWIAELEEIGLENEHELFGTGEEEPLASWRHCWQESLDRVNRLAAILLAAAWQTEQRRV